MLLLLCDSVIVWFGGGVICLIQLFSSAAADRDGDGGHILFCPNCGHFPILSILIQRKINLVRFDFFFNFPHTANIHFRSFFSEVFQRSTEFD